MLIFKKRGALAHQLASLSGYARRFQIENAGEPDLTIKLAAVLALAAIDLAGLGLPQPTPPAT